LQDIIKVSANAPTANTTFKQEIMRCITTLVNRGAKPPSYKQLWEKKSQNNLQKEYVGQIENRIATEVVEADGTELIRARVHSASSKFAHRWITTLPTERFFVLTNNQFSHSIRNLLALPIRSDLPILCSCSKQVNLSHDPHHPTVCTKVCKKGAITAS